MSSFSLLRFLTMPAVAVVAAASGCPGSNGFECECFPCTGAISLNVVDDAGNALGGDWTVEANLDGEVVDTSSCDPSFRNGVNTCTFGFTAGVYEIVIRSPREEKELKGRFASRAGQDCCNCVTGEVISVVLEQG
jgi:hypothetical protein